MFLLTNISFTFWVVAYGSFDCVAQRSGGSRPSDKGGRGEGAGHPHPEIRGGGGQSPKKFLFFLPFRPHFGRKIREGAAPPSPSPGRRHCRRVHVLLNEKVYVFNRNVCDYE